MKTLITVGAAMALLVGASVGEVAAERSRLFRIPAFLGRAEHPAPTVATVKKDAALKDDDNQHGRSTLLEAALIPASGGMATSVTSAKLEISSSAGVELKIRGLAGSGGPITDTGSLAIGLIVNGSAVPPATFGVPVVNGDVTVAGSLPVAQGDVVEVTGFRILDSGGTLDLLRAGGTIQGQVGQFEVEGKISNLAGSCPTVTFDVGGLTVTTDANTQYEDGDCGTLANGVKVEVEGVTQGNIHLATRVEFDDD